MAKGSNAKSKPGEFKNRIVGLEMVQASELATHPKNWRQHPADQRSALLGTLEAIGVADAVLAYKSDETGLLTLIDGHLRQELLDQEIPVLVTDLSDEEADALLATHDVLTMMAVPDEDELRGLLEQVAAEDVLPHDVLIAIDPDYAGEEFDAPAPDGSTPKYELVPQLDEGYDYVVIFSTRESEFAWLETALDLPKKKDKTRIGTSRVLTVPEFRKLWAERGDD